MGESFMNEIEMSPFDIYLNESMNDHILDLGMIEDLYMMEKKSDDSKEDNALLEKIKKLGQKLKNMLDKIIETVKKAMISMKNKISKKMATAKIRLHIKYIKMMKKDKEIEFIDVWKLEKVMMAESVELGLLCTKWSESYAKRGKGVMAANKFEDMFNHVVRTHEEKIERIKKEKIQVSSLKVKEWLLKNTKSNSKFCGPMNAYKQQIEKSKSMLEDIKAKKEIFIEETGYDNGPVTFTRVVHNGLGYVKRNFDWISMFFLSSVTFIGSRVYKNEVLRDIANHDITDDLQGDEATFDDKGVAHVDFKKKSVKVKARRYYGHSDHAVEAKKKIKKMDAVSGALGAMAGFTLNNANNKERRNSI